MCQDVLASGQSDVAEELGPEKEEGFALASDTGLLFGLAGKEEQRLSDVQDEFGMSPV